MNCPKCGSKNPEDNLFCGKCGASLSSKSESQPKLPWKRYCNYCQFKEENLPNGSSYCSWCYEEAFQNPNLQKPPFLTDEESTQSKKASLKTSLSVRGRPSFAQKASRLERTLFRKKEKISWKSYIKENLGLFLFFLLIIFIFAIFLFYSLKIESSKNLKEAREYLEFTDRAIKAYPEIVRDMGSIANQVYLPGKGDFESRREDALKKIEDLKEKVKKNYNLLKKSKPKKKELKSLKENLSLAYKILLQTDLPELEEFIRTIDTNLISSMMKGELSQAPFIRAISISKDASSHLDKAIEIWYEEKDLIS